MSGGLAQGSMAPAAALPTDDLFEQHQFEISSAGNQTVLPGFFLGGAIADLAVVDVSEDGERRLRIYAFRDGGWASVLEAPLRPGVVFVDKARSSGRDRLITYEPGRLSWFDPDSALERELAELALDYNATPEGLHYVGASEPCDDGDVPHVDITRDLNRDGLDDLVVPDVDGFWIATQLEGGSFAEFVKLGPPEPFLDEIGVGDTRTYGEVGISPLTIPWYLSRLHEVDYDRDGRSDLMFWNAGRFDVHRQDKNGRFSPVAESFTVDFPFDSDGAYSVIFGLQHKSTFSQILGLGRKNRLTVLRSVGDMNGDGVADLVTHSMEGRSILRQRSRYEVHFGMPTPGGIAFAQGGSTAIEPRGRAGAMEFSGYSSIWFADFDGNGQVDIVRGDVEMGVGAMIRALLGTSISLGAELYGMEDGVYPNRATTRRKMKVDVDWSKRGRDAGFFPAVLVGDVNGDGRPDIVLGKSREKLYVLLGGSGLLTRQPHEVAVRLPGDERNSWLVDLNQDGKQDVLMHHPSATEPHEVTMLIAR